MKRSLLFLLVFLLVFAGCQKRQVEREAATFGTDDSEYLLTVLIDMSGSFQHMMAEDGKAYDFLLAVVDKYFRDRIGSSDRILIAQICNTKRSLLWEGTPTQLRQQFSSAAKFRDFLIANSDPNGSYVHDGIAHTLRYIRTDPQIVSGKAKSGVFVLSDLLESSPDPEESKKRLVEELTKYGEIDGAIGFYYVDQMVIPDWREELRACGVEHCVLEADVVGYPILPELEQ